MSKLVIPFIFRNRSKHTKLETFEKPEMSHKLIRNKSYTINRSFDLSYIIVKRRGADLWEKGRVDPHFARYPQ